MFYSPFLILLIVILSLLQLSLAQNVIYLAPNGSDGSNLTNSCRSKDSPCATLRHAVNQSSSGDIVLLSAGQYFEPVNSSLGSIVLHHALSFQSAQNDSAVVVSQLIDMDPFCRNRTNALDNGENYFAKCSLFVLDDTYADGSATASISIEFRGVSFRQIFFALWHDLRVTQKTDAMQSATVIVSNVVASNLIFGFIALRKAAETLAAGVAQRQITISNLVITDSVILPSKIYLYGTAPYQNCITVASNWDNGFLQNLRFENVSSTCLFGDPRIFDNLITLGNCNSCVLQHVTIRGCSCRSQIYFRAVAAKQLSSFTYTVRNVTSIGNQLFSVIRSQHYQSDFSFKDLEMTDNYGYGFLADFSALVFLVAPSSLDIKGVRASRNRVDALFLMDTIQQANIQNIIVDAKRWTTLGCLRSLRVEMLALTDSIFEGCYSRHDGGFHSSTSDLTVSLNNITVTNAMSEANGGAIAASNPYSYALQHVRILKARAVKSGGAIYAAATNMPGLHFVSFNFDNYITNCRAKDGSAIVFSNVIIPMMENNQNYRVFVQGNIADQAGTFTFHNTSFYSEHPIDSPLFIIQDNRARAAACFWIEDPWNFLIDYWRQMSSCLNNIAELYANEYASAPVGIKLLDSTIRRGSNRTQVVRNGEQFKLKLALEDYYSNIVQQYPSIVNIKLLHESGFVEHSHSITMAVDDTDAQPWVSLVFEKAKVMSHAVVQVTWLGSTMSNTFSVVMLVEPCPSGMYTIQGINDTRAQGCALCSPGSFSSSPDSKLCDSCPQGFFAPSSGMSICSPCPSWTISGLQDKGQSTEEQCKTGTRTLIILLVLFATAITCPLLLVPCVVYLYIKRKQSQKLAESLLKNDYLSIVQEQMKQGADATQALMTRLPKHLRLGRDDIHIGQMLGNGSQAALFSGVFQGSAIAIKLYHKRTIGFEQANMEEFVREVDIQARFGNHPSLVRLIGVCDFDAAKVGLVTELMKGSLASMILMRNLLYKRTDKLLTMSWRQKKHILKSIAAGMAHLHSNGVLHRDLKPENVLVDEDAVQVKICDFGFSKALSDSKLSNSSNMTLNVGTASYIAPEQIGESGTAGRELGTFSDVQSTENENEKLLNSSSKQGSSSSSGSSGVVHKEKDFERLSKMDVFSFGVLMAALLMETTKPYGELADIDIIWRVKARAQRPEIDEQLIFASAKILAIEQDGLSQQQANETIIEVNKALELVRRCWSEDPRQRPSFKEILRSPALAQGASSPLLDRATKKLLIMFGYIGQQFHSF